MDEDEFVEENEEFDTYVEVPSEDEYEDYDDEDFSLNDAAFTIFMAVLVCGVFAFIVRTVSKHLKNVNLKVGNKIEIGIESKDKEDKEK